MTKQMIKAELLLASHNKINSKTLYTFKFTFPRIILAEINTHKVLVKNTSSSRAVPAKTFRSKILNDPFTPQFIGANQKGMQAGEELSGWRRKVAEGIMSGLRYPPVFGNWMLEKLGVHKQIANRYLEPWMWVEQIVSGTEWQNFINLRAHPKAEPHFQCLAYQVKDIIFSVNNAIQSTDKLFDKTYGANGNFPDKFRDLPLYFVANNNYVHAPLVTHQELKTLPHSELLDISAARCARVSYFLPDSTKPSNIEKDRELIQKLTGEDPKHLSPFEHQGIFTTSLEWSGNFKGWIQYRKTFYNEDGNIPC